MKLTGGHMRGRKVKACGMGVKSGHGALRATSSRVREAVFNIIAPSLDGRVFADLYSGTGTMGMEAMSRGASRVYFVESDTSRYRKLLETLGDCGCVSKAEMFNDMAADFIRDLSAKGGAADVFFLDPPYDSDELDIILPLIGKSGVLSDGAMVLAEHNRRKSLPNTSGRLEKIKTYKYGDTMLTLYMEKNG